MIFFIGIFYLATRLINLTIIPIFTDEALYLRWAQWGMGEPSKYFFISLLDGKQPLFIWLTYPVLAVIKDPLVAGRLVSVFAGLISTLFLYKLGLLIFKNKRIATLSSFCYIVFPFAVINDRLALYDSLLAMLAIISVYFQILLVKKQEFKTAIFLGATMGMGFLTKSSASFFLTFAPLPIIFMKEKSLKNIFHWAKYLALSILIALSISAILYVSPLHGMVKMKNEVFLLTLTQFISNPFYGFLGNIKGLLSYFPPYFSWVWVFIIVFSVVSSLIIMTKHLLLRHSQKNKLQVDSNGATPHQNKFSAGQVPQWSNALSVVYLFFLFFFPFISLAFFAKIIYPRFIFFMVFPLLIILAWQTNWFIEKIASSPSTSLRIPRNNMIEGLIKLIILVFIIFLPAYNSFLIITNPISASLPPTDSEQLLNSWPAGYGVSQVVDYIKSRPADSPIFIGTEGTEGLFPHALEIYLYKNQNVQIKGYWPVEDIPLEVRGFAKTRETYFIYKDTLQPKPQENVEEIFHVRRGIGENWLVLLRILSPQ